MNHGTLPPEVEGFASGAFLLGADLAHLERVRKAGAPEAVVFYSSRVLEALSSAAVERMQLAPLTSAFGNLQLLERYGLLQGSARYWAHGLRRLGNEIRHLLRGIRVLDAEFSVLCLERWLEWFFCSFPLGPRLEQLTVGDEPATLTAGGPWGELIEIVASRPETSFSARVASHPALATLAGETPTIPALLGEALLDTGEPAAAEQLVAKALERFPDDLRLGQLRGLAWSRLGQLDAARQTFESLRRRSPDDEETIGMLAGAYKRLWESLPAERGLLVKSHRAYHDGWRRSRQENAYLGINAATTALLLGDTEHCREVAAQVQHVLRARRQRIGDCPISSYWDQVTLAEAELLLGNGTEAKQAYAAALIAHPEKRGNLAVTRHQAERILERLGDGDPARVLDAFAP